MKEALLDGQNTLSMALSLIRYIILHPSYEVLKTPLVQRNNNNMYSIPPYIIILTNNIP